jgi:hypothetical protein
MLKYFRNPPKVTCENNKSLLFSIDLKKPIGHQLNLIQMPSQTLLAAGAIGN